MPYRKPTPDPDWFDFVREGDVLRAPSGDLRVVRRVSWHRGAKASRKLWGVVFVIRRCSWTKRCDTVMTATDLKTRGFTHTGARVKLNKTIDALVRESIDARMRLDAPLSCCDAKGLP